MGRRKIPIQQITDPKLRLITFHKRKKGLIKKAAEMSLLCNVNLVLIFEDGFENLIQFSKNRFTSMDTFLKECKYNNVLKLTADEYPSFEKMTRYRNTVSVEGQEKISYEDEMIEKDHSHDSDSDEEFIYFNKNDAPREDSNNNNKHSSKKSKRIRDQSPDCKESPDDDQASTLVKNETEAEDLYLKNEYAEFTPPQPSNCESQKLDMTKMMASDQIGETMRVAGQRGVEYMRQFNTTYGDHQQYLSAAASLNNYPSSMGNLMAAPMTQMFPYNNGNNSNNMAIKNQKMINFLMSSKDRPMFSQQIFPSKEAVTDLNNPPVHNNRELGRSPNFINQNSLYFDRPVLNSSSINSEKQRMLHTMLCKHQEMPNPAVYKNYAQVQVQGEENIKMEESHFYGGNLESALRNDQTTLEKIKKKIKTD